MDKTESSIQAGTVSHCTVNRVTQVGQQVLEHHRGHTGRHCVDIIAHCTMNRVTQVGQQVLDILEPPWTYRQALCLIAQWTGWHRWGNRYLNITMDIQAGTVSHCTVNRVTQVGQQVLEHHRGHTGRHCVSLHSEQGDTGGATGTWTSPWTYRQALCLIAQWTGWHRWGNRYLNITMDIQAGTVSHCTVNRVTQVGQQVLEHHRGHTGRHCVSLHSEQGDTGGATGTWTSPWTYRQALCLIAQWTGWHRWGNRYLNITMDIQAGTVSHCTVNRVTQVGQQVLEHHRGHTGRHCVSLHSEQGDTGGATGTWTSPWTYRQALCLIAQWTGWHRYLHITVDIQEGTVSHYTVNRVTQVGQQVLEHHLGQILQHSHRQVFHIVDIPWTLIIPAHHHNCEINIKGLHQMTSFFQRWPPPPDGDVSWPVIEQCGQNISGHDVQSRLKYLPV